MNIKKGLKVRFEEERSRNLKLTRISRSCFHCWRHRLGQWLRDISEVEREDSCFPVDLAPTPLCPHQFQEGDDITLWEGQLVFLLTLIVEQCHATWAADRSILFLVLWLLYRQDGLKRRKTGNKHRWFYDQEKKRFWSVKKNQSTAILFPLIQYRFHCVVSSPLCWRTA